MPLVAVFLCMLFCVSIIYVFAAGVVFAVQFHSAALCCLIVAFVPCNIFSVHTVIFASLTVVYKPPFLSHLFSGGRVKKLNQLFWLRKYPQ